MVRKYLLSAFSPKMVDNEAIWFYKVPVEEAIELWNQESPNEEKKVVIGHESTAMLFDELGFRGITKAERIPVKLKERDRGIICLPSFRLPEGKVLSKKELEDLVKEGKIVCYGFKVLKPYDVGEWTW